MPARTSPNAKYNCGRTGFVISVTFVPTFNSVDIHTSVFAIGKAVVNIRDTLRDFGGFD